MSETETDTLSITIEREVPHPAEKVWRALTQPHLLAEWLMEGDFQAEKGERFRFTASWGGVEGEVQHAVPHKELRYSWDSKDLRSIVTWRLTPTAKGTLIQMEQNGFLKEQRAYYQGARVGWPRFLSALERVLDRMGAEEN